MLKQKDETMHQSTVTGDNQSMSKAHDKALEILEERDMNLTEEDVKEIERLSKSFTEEEKQALSQLFEIIEQIKMHPDSNFNRGSQEST